MMPQKNILSCSCNYRFSLGDNAEGTKNRRELLAIFAAKPYSDFTRQFFGCGRKAPLYTALLRLRGSMLSHGLPSNPKLDYTSKSLVFVVRVVRCPCTGGGAFEAPIRRSYQTASQNLVAFD